MKIELYNIKNMEFVRYEYHLVEPHTIRKVINKIKCDEYKGQILVKPVMLGICGSDVLYFKVIGMRDWKVLRGNDTGIRLRPKFFWWIVSDFTQFYAKNTLKTQNKFYVLRLLFSIGSQYATE